MHVPFFWTCERCAVRGRGVTTTRRQQRNSYQSSKRAAGSSSRNSPRKTQIVRPAVPTPIWRATAPLNGTTRSLEKRPDARRSRRLPARSCLAAPGVGILRDVFPVPELRAREPFPSFPYFNDYRNNG